MAKYDLIKALAIGEELFRTQGYHHTGTSEILEKSGLPRSSFYHHFTNKEGFVVRVLEHYGEASLASHEQVLANQKLGTPLTRFKLLMKHLADLAHKQSFTSQCLIQKMANESAGSNELIRKAAELELNKLLHSFRDCIKEGQLNGEFRTDIEAMEQARFLYSQLYGSYTIARLMNSSDLMLKNFDMALDYLTM